jgi:hypothetical protein
MADGRWPMADGRWPMADGKKEEAHEWITDSFIAVFCMRRTDGFAGLKGISTWTDNDTKWGIRNFRQPPKFSADGQRHEVRNPQLSATAEVFVGCLVIWRKLRRLTKVFDSEIRNSFRLCPASSLTCQNYKLLDLKSGRARRMSIGQTSKQIATTFGDTNFGEKTNGLIMFT